MLNVIGSQECVSIVQDFSEYKKSLETLARTNNSGTR